MIVVLSSIGVYWRPGFNFLTYLQTLVGGESVMNPFLRAHCQRFAPEWDRVASALHALQPNVNISVVKIDGTKNDALMLEAGVAQFPLIVYQRVDLRRVGAPTTTTVYRGMRTQSLLTEFAVRMTS